MDRRRLDDIAPVVAEATTRRSALRLLAGATVGAAFGTTWAQGASAAVCRPEGAACRRPNQCCSGSCRERDGAKTCRSTRDQGTCTIERSAYPDPPTTDAACGDASKPNWCLCAITLRGTAFCGQEGTFCLADGEACTSDAHCKEVTATATAVCLRDACGAGRAGCGYPCPTPA